MCFYQTTVFVVASVKRENFGKGILSSHTGFCDNRQRQGPGVDIIKLEERPGNLTENQQSNIY